MAKIEKMEGVIAQTDLIVIPIIDVSGSMYGEKIGQVNDGMRGMKPQLVKINDESLETKLKVAPLEFSSGARWLVKKPEDVDTFVWYDLQSSGVTDFGAALSLLKNVLTVKEKGGWMDGRGGSAPVLLLISDGGPTDNYKKNLDELKKRGWFKAALKFAIAVGSDADESVLAEFTGNKEAVVRVDAFNNLSAIIKHIIVSASITMSQNQSTGFNKLNNNPNALVEDLTNTDDVEKVNQQTVKDVVKSLDDLSIDDDFS